MFKIINRDTQKRRLAKEGPQQILQNEHNKILISKEQNETNLVARAVQKAQINPKHNKKHNLDYKFIWENYEVPEIK